MSGRAPRGATRRDHQRARRLEGEYVGYADDLKYFTFTAGTFSAGQLDYAAAAVLEPSTCALLLGLGALGAVGLLRRVSSNRRCQEPR